MNTKLRNCKNRIKLTDIPSRKSKNVQPNRVGKRKEKMVKSFEIITSKFKNNSKAAIRENKVEKVVIDNTVIVVQFEAFENFRKDPDNNNIEEKPRCALNYIDSSDTSENRMLNDKIVNAAQKILKKQFAKANGLQDPIKGQGLKSIEVFHLYSIL